MHVYSPSPRWCLSSSQSWLSPPSQSSAGSPSVDLWPSSRHGLEWCCVWCLSGSPPTWLRCPRCLSSTRWRTVWCPPTSPSCWPPAPPAPDCRPWRWTTRSSCASSSTPCPSSSWATPTPPSPSSCGRQRLEFWWVSETHYLQPYLHYVILSSATPAILLVLCRPGPLDESPTVSWTVQVHHLLADQSLDL